MGRRSKGEGSIFQTATGWRGYISLGGGKRKYASGKTRKECQAALRRLQAEQQAGRDLGQPSQRVEQFLTTWLEQVVRRQRAEKTHHSYAQMCRLHLIPRIGHHRLDKLSPEHVQSMVNDIVDQGLSARTADYARSILRAALSTAMRYGYVTRNVAALVDVPKGKKFEAQPLTIDQARVFLAAVAGHRLDPLYRLTLALGLRQGEVINLTWEHVDLEQSLLTIAVSKTGKRTVALTPALCTMLRQHKIRLAEEHLACREWKDEGWLFPSAVGSQLGARNLVTHFKKVLEQAGLPGSVRFHDLRHTAASLWAANGIHPRVAMELLGHRQIATTMEVYSHVHKPEQQQAIETIEALFGT